MLLKNLKIPSNLDTSSSDIIRDFFEPVLKSSIRYDRGVGFFSAGWLRIAAHGMSAFARNSGVVRWVTSPILSKDDWEAIKFGHEAREDPAILAIISKNLDELETSLEKETLSTLSWLVADGILDFKLALPRNKLDQGEFHDKFGIFTDEGGNQVSFNGSYNDSIQGTRNYESIKIFKSWDEPLSSFVKSDCDRFECLWNNLDPNVRVYDLPEAAVERIVRLRDNTRPYPAPDDDKIRRIKETQIPPCVIQPKRPGIPPEIKLRQYQEQAIEAWMSTKNHGILQMATGTGKTLAALASVIRLLKAKERLILIITCPFIHLVEQWSDEARKFGFQPINVGISKELWESEVANQLRNFKKERKDIVTIITTNASFQSDALINLLEPFLSETLLIIDEVHNAGSPNMLKALSPSIPWRLGLSATPIRHYDDIGSAALLEYFNGIVFDFGLDKAIGKYLTPYFYHPIPVEMSHSEFDEYCELSRQLIKHIDHKTGSLKTEAGKMIAIKRSRIQNNSIAKYNWLRENIEPYADMNFTLFYVGESLFDSVRQLLGAEKHIGLHEFTHKQNSVERKDILKRFRTKELQALVAMKCLDEGVDVPPTRTAYFLASSGNPREFVQRRGRVLRLSEGKDFATIYDLISMPPREFIDYGPSHPNWSAVRSAVRREYKRIKEFAKLSENHYQALDSLFEIVNILNILED